MSTTKRILSVLAVTFFIVGGFFIIGNSFNPQQGEALSNVPATYVTDGQVNAITKIGNTIYFGGNFGELRTHTGYGIVVDQSAGSLASFSNVNGPVFAVEPDGADGWYIAGDFTFVGPNALSGIAHILSSGAVDTAFTPSTDGTVNALDFDGTNLYIGGAFTQINGTTRNNAGAVDTTGAITAFDPNVNGSVATVAVDASTVYVGGSFSNAGGAGRNNIAALDSATGTASAWNPNADAGVSAIAVDGTEVYTGGSFANIGGAARNYIAAIDSTTGNATAWNANADAAVNTLAVDASNVFAGGTFANIGGAARNSLAALDKTTGVATGWNPNVNGPVTTIELGTSNIFFGGSFSDVGGTTRNNAASVNILGVASSWDPDLSATVNSLALSSTQAFIGGAFNGAGAATTRLNAAAIDETTGALTAWNPTVDGPVNTLANDGSDIYIGGSFATVDGAARNNIAKVGPTTGSVTAWDPNADALVNEIDIEGNLAYVVGGFTNIGGAARNRAAALDTSTGLANAWNPDANATVNTVAVDGSTVYLGGNFATLGGNLRFFIGAVDTATGATSVWNPTANSSVNSLQVDGSNVYAGGNFTNIGGAARAYVAALDTTSGAASSWNPSADGQVHSLALDPANGKVYVGGSFNNIGGTARLNLAELDQTTGAATSWNVNIDNSKQIPFDLLVDNSMLYAGGSIGQGSDGFVAWFVKPVIEFALANSSGAESSTPALLQVVLSGTDSQDVTVNYTITGGSATNGTDYTLAAGTVTIPAGATSANISATIIDDTLVEGDETFVVTLSSPSTNATLGTILDHTYTILDDDVNAPTNVIRIPESDPIDQAVAISKLNFPNGGANAAVICRDNIIVDCFVGGPLANIAGATMLLTNTNTLSPATATELQRAVTQGATVYVLGETQAVSASVEAAIQALGYSTTRLGGAERIATSVQVAQETQNLNPVLTSQAYLTENRRFVDSIGISAVASERVSDQQVDLILLNERGSATLDSNTDGFLSNHPEIIRLELIGGTAALDGALESAIGAAHPGLTLSRISGATRWDTNANIATQYFTAPSTIVVVNGENNELPGAVLNAASASGASFFSALLAGNFAGTQDAPLLISQATVLPTQIQNYITSHSASINLAYIVGTTAQISTAIENWISANI